MFQIGRKPRRKMPRIERRKGTEGGTGTYLEYRYGENYIELWKIFVNPQDRKKGIATSMFKELIGIAEKDNINKIAVRSSTDPSKEVFGKWLVKQGFKRIKHPNYQWRLIIS